MTQGNWRDGREVETIYYLKGDEAYPAVRVGNSKPDKCGQVSWLFIGGEWDGKTVMVEPEKMIPATIAQLRCLVSKAAMYGRMAETRQYWHPDGLKV